MIRAQPGLQLDEQGVAGDAVERGKRLIEKKQTRRGRERSSKGDALRLAAGEILRAAEGEFGCANQFQHFVDAVCACGAFKMSQAEGYVGLSVEVREERRLLRDKRSFAMARRGM